MNSLIYYLNPIFGRYVATKPKQRAVVTGTAVMGYARMHSVVPWQEEAVKTTPTAAPTTPALQVQIKCALQKKTSHVQITFNA